ERVNNNSNYAFVLEDPSKPRKYQLNFNLGSEYVKDLKHIPVTAMDHHNPQQQRHADLLPNRQPVSSITLPPIRELILPPLSSINHQQPHSHVQQESIPLSSRPHLPPLQHSFDPPQNPSSYNYQTAINDRANDNHTQFSPPEVAHYHPHHGYPTANNVNHHYQHPSVSHHHHHVSQQPSQVPHLPQAPPLPHHQTYQSQQPPLPHLYQQQQPLPQNSNHVHHQQQHSQLHHHHHQSHVYNNEIVPERNQHDYQPSSVSVGYNRQPYYTQILNDNGPSQMIASQPSNMVTPSHDHQIRFPDSIANYSPQPIQPMYKKVQQAPITDLLNSSHQPPPLNPVSPPKSLHLQPSQQQYPHENRETSPFYLAPPSHHQSGSNSSVSTRSSSPAPSTPVASFLSSPNNNLSQFVEKPIDQSLPPKKTSIVPAGPLPVQQPVTAPTQSQSNVTNDDIPVFVQYVVPTPDIGSQPNISKSTTRPRKNSLTTSNGVLPSSQKRTRKPKDVSVSKDITHEDKKSRSINRTSSEIPSECCSSDIPIQNLKRDYSCVPDSQIVEYKPSQEIIDDSTMMNGVIESKDENIETALILNSLKNNIIPISNTDTMNVDSKNIEMKNIDTKDVDMKDVDINVDKNIMNNNIVDTNVMNNNIVDTNIMNNNIVDTNIMNKNIISNSDINTNELMDGQKLATKVRQLSIHEENPVKEENDDDPQMKFPIISRSGSFNSSKRHQSPIKKSVLDIDKRVCDDNSADNRVVNNIVHIKQEHVPIDNPDNDSDNDLAMDDDSDDDEFSKRKQPKRDNELDNNVQWNSDDMETEEEVEEEVEIYQTTSSISGKDDNRKQTVIYSSSPPSSTSFLQGINRVKVEDVKDTSIITGTTTIKPTFPVSPNTNGSGTMSRKASTSSSISRKGSTSSNGSNKDAASNTPCSDVSDTLSTSTSIPPFYIFKFLLRC
ncbi:7314_t:CDS:2, partial [Scutellospora calospora]